MFNNNGESKMFGKKKEQKKVWLVIEKISYSDNTDNFYVAKKAYSLDEATAFKVSLDQLNDRDTRSYFLATDVDTAMDKVITLHNQKVANDNK